MKTVTQSARHGELYIDRVSSLPNGIKKVNPDKNMYVVAHSESGHNHVIDANESVNIYSTDDPMLSYLEVIEVTDKVECLLRHLKAGDESHETFKIVPGIYELRIQSEADSSPSGWRKAAD